MPRNQTEAQAAEYGRVPQAEWLRSSAEQLEQEAKAEPKGSPRRKVMLAEAKRRRQGAEAIEHPRTLTVDQEGKRS